MNIIRALVDAINSSIKLLQRLADGMDMVLNISFTPKSFTMNIKK